jgi:hypothetical protein
MIKAKSAKPGRRSDHGSLAGGRRYTDPSGTRVAVHDVKQTGRQDDERINPDQDQAAGPMAKDEQRHLNR